MYDFLLPHEKEAIQAHEAKLKRQGLIPDSPKFKYGQRVFDVKLGFGWLIIKGLRFLTEPVKEGNQITYKSPSGEPPAWEYHCYRVTHQEIGWFKEDELSPKDGLI